MASLAGKAVYGAGIGYSMTKFAAVALSHATRHAGWGDGVRCTALCPGYVATDMTAAVESVPLDQMIAPDDLAEVVLTVLSLSNTASIADKEGNPNASAYSAAKAGVIGLTKSLGKELAQDGILVNCFTPAVIQTDILKQISQQHIDYMLSKIPMGRFGEVDEAASLVAWLASEECSFTTGGVFDLSGGRATY